MGDVSSKDQRISSFDGVSAFYSSSQQQQQQQQQQRRLYHFLGWYHQYCCLPRPKTTQCDDLPPLPPVNFNPDTTATPTLATLPPPSLPSESLPPPPPPPSSSSSSDDADRIAAAAASVAGVPNPGTYENAAMDTRRILSLDTHDGFRCDINKQLNPFMAVVHSFWLGTSMIPDGRTQSYTALTQVANEQGLLMARVDPYRQSVDGRIHSAFPIPFRLQLGVSADGQSDQLLAEVDLGQETWTANLKYGSMGGGLIWGCNYFQSITPRLAMGGEGMYISSNNNLLSSYTIKYTIPAISGDEDSTFATTSSTISTTTPLPKSTTTTTTPELKGSSTICANFNLGQALLTLSYLRVVTPQRVTLAAELQCNPVSLDSQVMLGAEFKMSRNKLTTVIDGTGKIQSVVETKLEKAPGSPSLNFTAEMDHLKDTTRFGFGLSFEG